MNRVTLTKEGEKVKKQYTNKLLFWSYSLKNLSTFVHWGIKVKSISAETCEVSIPFSWRTQNPFNSIYFAALAGASELSSGALCQVLLAGKGRWSMLVVDYQIEFLKKANTTTVFTCTQGQKLFDTIENIEKTGEPQQVKLISVGTNTDGVEVAKAVVTWSLKQKSIE